MKKTENEKETIRLDSTLDEILNFTNPGIPFERRLIEEIARGYSARIEPDGIDGGSRLRAIYDRVEQGVREAMAENGNRSRSMDATLRDKVISAAFNKCASRFGWEPEIALDSPFLKGSTYLEERAAKENTKPAR